MMESSSSSPSTGPWLNSLGFINYSWDGRFPWELKGQGEEFIGSNNPLSSYPEDLKGLTSILALDCEMVTLVDSDGLCRPELGRVSVVNKYGYCVYDAFVRPEGVIFDTNQKWTGITMATLDEATPIATVLDHVASLAEKRLLVGHSIRNDLNVLRLRHHPVIGDTQILYKHRYSADYPQSPGPGLYPLAKRFLGFDEKVTFPKSSILDAQLTLKLYQKYVGGDLPTPTPAPPLIQAAQPLFKTKVKVRPDDLLLPCGHKYSKPTLDQRLAPLESIKCNVMLRRNCPCGHSNNVPCHMDPGEYKCPQEASMPNPCAYHSDTKMVVRCHIARLSSVKEAEDFPCWEIVQVSCTAGLHLQYTPCHKALKKGAVGSCNARVKRKLECGHWTIVLCAQKNMPLCTRGKCGKPPGGNVRPTIPQEAGSAEKPVLVRRLKCGHKIASGDAEEEDPACIAMVKCRHKFEHPCDPARRALLFSGSNISSCPHPCLEALPCGHECPLGCHGESDLRHANVLCQQACSRVCQNGHSCSASDPQCQPHLCSGHRENHACRKCNDDTERSGKAGSCRIL